MSASHHGNPNPEGFDEARKIAQEALMKRFLEQAEGKAKREYSQGRMSADDEGDLAMAILADEAKKLVVIRFGKPVEWIGMGETECKALISNLIHKLRCIATKPFTLEV